MSRATSSTLIAALSWISRMRPSDSAVLAAISASAFAISPASSLSIAARFSAAILCDSSRARASAAL